MLNLASFAIDGDNTKICFGEEQREAIDDICQILSLWFEKVPDAYNDSLSREFQFKMFTQLYDYTSTKGNGIYKNKIIRGRLVYIRQEVTLKDLNSMVSYKRCQNKNVHKLWLNPSKSEQKCNAAYKRLVASGHKRIAIGRTVLFIIEKL